MVTVLSSFGFKFVQLSVGYIDVRMPILLLNLNLKVSRMQDLINIRHNTSSECRNKGSHQLKMFPNKEKL